MSWFEPDEAHAAACIRRFGNGKLAVASCNRCKWIKNRHKWCKRCPWLREASTGQWGIGCVGCSQSLGAGGSPFGRFTKGQTGVLQLEDLLRHSSSEHHIAAMKDHHSSSGQPQPQEKQPGTSSCPTAAQIRLALEICHCPLGAQANEYQRKAELASRGDSTNYPMSFNSRATHGKLMRCAAKVLRLGKSIMFVSWSCYVCCASDFLTLEPGMTMIESCCRQIEL